MQQPDRACEQGYPGRIASPVSQRPQDLSRQGTQQQAVEHMDNEIGAFERPGVGRPVVGVCQEGQHGDRPPGRAGVTTEYEGAKRFPVRHAAHQAQ